MAGRGAPLGAELVDSLSRRAGMAFAVELPDGSRCESGDGAASFTIVFHSDAALLATFTPGHVGLLESYFDQSVDMLGDPGAAFAAAMAIDAVQEFIPTCFSTTIIPVASACRRLSTTYATTSSRVRAP